MAQNEASRAKLDTYGKSPYVLIFVNKKPKKQVRSSKFTLLLTKDELKQLHELASENGEPAAVLLRRFIRIACGSKEGA